MVFTWHYRYRHHHTVGYGVVVSSRWWEQRQRRRALPVQCVSMEWSAAGIIIIIQKYKNITQLNKEILLLILLILLLLRMDISKAASQCTCLEGIRRVLARCPTQGEPVRGTASPRCCGCAMPWCPPREESAGRSATEGCTTSPVSPLHSPKSSFQHQKCDDYNCDATLIPPLFDCLVCLFAWCLTALSAEIGYIVPQSISRTAGGTIQKYCAIKQRKNTINQDKHSSAWTLWRWSPRHG